MIPKDKAKEIFYNNGKDKSIEIFKKNISKRNSGLNISYWKLVLQEVELLISK